MRLFITVQPVEAQWCWAAASAVYVYAYTTFSLTHTFSRCQKTHSPSNFNTLGTTKPCLTGKASSQVWSQAVEVLVSSWNWVYRNIRQEKEVISRNSRGIVKVAQSQVHICLPVTMYVHSQVCWYKCRYMWKLPPPPHSRTRLGGQNLSAHSCTTLTLVSICL